MSDYTSLRHHLKQIVKLSGERKTPYNSAEDFILKHGKRFDGQKLQKPWEFDTVKQCFMNSQKLAMSDHTLTYVEGYVMALIPVHHAWCVDLTGEVIDVTLRSAVDGTVYFGCKFQTRYVERCVLRREVWASLLSYGRCPLLTGEHSPSEALQK